MIILFHMLYVMASSIVNVIASSLFTNTNSPNLNNIIHEEPQADLRLSSCEQSSTNAQFDVDDKVGLSLGLHDHLETSQSVSTKSVNLVVTNTEVKTEEAELEDDDENFRPIPPVYAQRYMAVKGVLMDKKWNGTIKKVIDFGCNNLAFFQYVKHMHGVEEVLMIDIDEELLKQFSCRVAPLNCDYLGTRRTPLLVQVLGGSIAQLDDRLVGTDAVVCIELIEHLWPDEVEALPYTVFGFILPRVAVFTTPNADFNVVFKNFHGFRHPDHKFEWTREQFECWANNIILRYPAYEVTFHGIGAGAPKTAVYGCCSQMAVFVRTPTFTKPEEMRVGEVYKLICDYDYPFKPDERSDEEKIQNESEYYLHKYSKYEIHQVEGGHIEIPLAVLLPHVETWCTSLEHLREVLEGAHWTISERDPETPVVTYPYYDPYPSSDEDVGESGLQDECPSVESVCEDSFLQSDEDWDACGGNTEGVQVNGWSGDDATVADWGPITNREEDTTPPCLAKPSQKLLPSADPLIRLVSKPNGHFTFTPNDHQRNEGLPRNKPTNEDLVVNMQDCSGPWEVHEPVGLLFQSSTLGSAINCDSTILMAGASVKSLDDAAISMAAETSNFISNSLRRSGSRNRLGKGAVSEELSTPSHESCSSSAEAIGGSDTCLGGTSSFLSSLSRPEQGPSNSSRSFFMNLLSGERHRHHACPASSRVSVGEQRMDLDQSPDAEDQEYDTLESDDSLSDHSQDGLRVDNRAVPRRVQPHRNHFPFGLNDAMVENGDVANNNRDGEGNNAVAFLDDSDSDSEEDIMLDAEVGDHEDDDDDDLDNANGPLLPEHANPFPPWLLHLLQVANDEVVELSAAGEPHIFLGDH